MKLNLLALVAGALLISTGMADDDFNAAYEQLLRDIEWPGSMRLCIGITRRGTRIWGVMDRDALDYSGSAPRVLAVAGLGGSQTDWEAVKEAIQRGLSRRQELGARLRLAVVPMANPDGYFLKAGTGNGSGGDPTGGYPPAGTAYNSATDPERAHIWRFVGWFAPDLLVEMQEEAAADWQAAVQSGRYENSWSVDSLASAASRQPPAEVGTVPAVRHVVGLGDPESEADRRRRIQYSGLARLGANPFVPDTDFPHSPARVEVLRRLARSPLEVLQSLAEHYGDHLNQVSYQPALAVMCRARLSELTGEPRYQEEVGRILEPYLAGETASVGRSTNGSQLAGHLVFADWVVRSGDMRGIDLVQRAADFAFDEDGAPREAMPYHNQMSDAVFMACPILSAAGRLSGEIRYFEMADRHLSYMQSLCLREDGIYRNSPLCDAAWGRGNGFPALGLALAGGHIDDYLQSGEPPEADRKRLEPIAQRFRSDLRAHLSALLQHQDVTGMWQQVIDEPGSYRELTCTCMIGYAMSEGIRRGWLDEAQFGPAVRRAWEGVKVRIGRDGKLLDVCTGTGKQRTLRDYLDRTAILGIDERGGAMAMMFAAQMAAMVNHP